MEKRTDKDIVILTDNKEETANLSKSLAFAIGTKHTAPQNFFGVGGMKIFRDLIYEMRGMMRADHKFYKKHLIFGTK